MRCIIDASVVAALVLPDEHSDACDQLAADIVDTGADAPSLLGLEVANLLLVAMRRSRISAAELGQALASFDEIGITFHPSPDAVQRDQILLLAQKHQLTAYDAAYLELCTRLGLPLASLDKQLVSAAAAEGVAVALK